MARRVADAFRGVPPQMSRQIEEGLAAVTTPEFWEVTDRGVNFDYIPEPQRGKLREFFRLIPSG